MLSLDRRVWPGFILILIFTGLASLFSQPLSLAGWLLLAAHTAFFRDPVREPSPGDQPLSPADGQVVEIATVKETDFLKEEAVKIGIFLSVLNVHINRSPIPGTIRYLQYVAGQFLNALHPSSGKKNESNSIGIEQGTRRILVRQIAGAIARHIHCDVRINDTVGRGQKLGMICYGSRTEIYVPIRHFAPTITLGDSVRAGKTILGEWR